MVSHEDRVLKPRRLRPGDTIGVIAPAGAVDETALERGIAVLEGRGFAVRRGKAVGERHGFLAGPEGARLEDLEEMVRDPSVAAVFAARGGYGAGRLLPHLDPNLLREHPKIIVGHSDVTFLLNYIAQRSGLVAFHGPMVCGFHERAPAVDALLAILGGEPMPDTVAPAVVRDGTGEGRLLGGCLSIVVAMLGTPYALRTRGCLLFLEDVNEKPYRIDRMLTQLRHAGALDGVAGLVVGEMPGCFDNPGDPALAAMLLDACGGEYPIVSGVPSGHGLGLVTLPLGARARLEGGRLLALESPVAG